MRIREADTAAEPHDESPDLTDPRVHAERDLSAFWRSLRGRTPVHWRPPRGDKPGFWVLTRHADLLRVYRDPARFRSSNGNMLPSLLHGGDTGSGMMLPVADRPRHEDAAGRDARLRTGRAASHRLRCAHVSRSPGARRSGRRRMRLRGAHPAGHDL